MTTSIELNQRPAIVIIPESGHHREAFAEVLFGIEEERIPYLLEKTAGLSLIETAYLAANRSDLSVGISCNQEAVIVHFRNLPETTPLFKLSRYHLKDQRILRALGANAARLVKRTAFKDLTEIGGLK